MQFLCILGRQPALGIAELESRFGAEAIQTLGRDMAVIESGTTIETFDEFGGLLKVGQIISTFNSTDWYKVTNHLIKELPGSWRQMDGGKLTLGLSTYGLNTRPQFINATALSLKKELRKKDCVGSVRVVPNKELALNTAQVLHNNLSGENGLELMLIRDGNNTLIVQTTWVQDIEAYRRRDQERPARDARVGMLPPKLAQIIINLAAPDAGAVFDPFCGTGVLLQEAILMKKDFYGSDLEPRMIEYTRRNLSWLAQYFDADFDTEHVTQRIQVADATEVKIPKAVPSIAAETYLGRPFNTLPDPQVLQQVIHDVNIIHKKFLQNVAKQTEPGYRLCIAVPAWHTKSGVKHLPTLDHLEELGYNRMSFVHVAASDLVYHREGQVVGRELVILTRR